MTPDNGSVWAEKWRAGWPTEVTVGPVPVLPSRGRDIEWARQADVRRQVLRPDFPGWAFIVRLSADGTMVGFEVVAATDRLGHPDHHPDDAPAVTARFIRRLPIGEIERDARRAERDYLATHSRPGAKYYGRAFAEKPRPGRGGRDDRAYAEVCARYVEMCESGSTRPVVELARVLCLSPSQANNILYAGRKRGLLGPAPAGRAGGKLTAKAVQLLEQDSDNEQDNNGSED